MNERLKDMQDEELLAVERELLKLTPAAFSPSLETRIEQAITPARPIVASAAPAPASSASAAPLTAHWQLSNLAALAAAACLALIAAAHLSRPAAIEPLPPEPKAIAQQPAPPQSLLALQQAMARSNVAALEAVDAAAQPRSSVHTASPPRACNAEDLAALLNGL